jgi:hypothetical protein
MKAADNTNDDLAQAIAVIGGKIDGLTDQVGGLAERMDGFDQRMEGFGQRLESFDQRMDGFDQRMEGFDLKLGETETRLKGSMFAMETRLSGEIADVSRRTNKRLDRLEDQFVALHNDIKEIYGLI